ncbi:MAG: hypothetical protein DRG78_04395 [Epsilonproteobacteria bacterium]|nr:MAG: hypothetical protein DRG78_04395 [Campylobacterota bacterium]
MTLKITDLNDMIKYKKKNTERLAENMPKINTSLISSMKSIEIAISSTDLENMINQNKISTSIFESYKLLTKSIKISDLAKLYNIKEPDIFKQKIINIEKINNKIEKGKLLSKIDIQSYLILVMTIIGFINDCNSIYKEFYSDNSEHIKTQLMIQKLNTEISSLKNIIIQYEVIKQVKVRDNSNSTKQSKVLDIVFPNQKLLLLNNKSKWIEVEYWNERKQETITGWVLKKYTKRLSK